jgi:hypothetical protein
MQIAFLLRRPSFVLSLLLLLFLFGVDSAAAHPAVRPLQTNVCGAITANTTWTTANSPYIMTCGVTVNAGITLTIQPGVVVAGSGFDRLQVKGHLSAQGTAVNPVIFTSEENNGPYQWSGIWFNGGTAHLNHTIVRYAGYNGPNIEVQLLPAGGEIRVENSQIRESGITPLSGRGWGI